MRTKSITLYYALTQKEVIPPKPEALERKEEWIRQLQKTVKADWEPVTIKVIYKIHNREVEKQRKFFNGPVVEYWVIQKCELLDGRPTRALITRARETLLADALGYKIKLWDKEVTRRKSTAEFTDTQEWNDLFETLRETEFEPNGYEMPKSEDFWELSKAVGYDKAKDQMIEKLQGRIKKKLSTP
jgi:hypothetical protein